MISRDDISSILRRIDGRGYKSYSELRGASESVDGVHLKVTKVQGDPFAPPSVVEISTVLRDGWRVDIEPIPLADLIHRQLSKTLPRSSMRGVGEGKSGVLAVPTPSPIMIPRSAVEARPLGGGGWRILARVWVGLPARRRRVLGREALELLTSRLVKGFRDALRDLDARRVAEHARAWVEQEFLRGLLRREGLVAFVGDGSILPRKCGGCWEPLEGAVPFESPPSLRLEVELPTGRLVSGMVVRRGVTTIAGPAFHGKTTLAEAISWGVWNHIPGDGRELVVSDSDLVYVESENGRWVSCVDVSPFINYLPGGVDVRCFTTRDASGATSIAASIQEFAEAGASGFVIDEDETATNMIHRDVWAEEVTGKRTINPLSDMSSELAKSGLSIVIVASGALPLLASSSEIVVMDEFRARDASFKRRDAESALENIGYRRVSKRYERPAERLVAKPLHLEKPRVKGFVAEARGLRDRVDLRPLKQVAEEQQLSTSVRVAAVIASRRRAPIARLAREFSQRLWSWDYSFLAQTPGPDISYVRHYEILYVLNRLPGLEACHTGYC
ncbi:MAG: ABC-ATPase domain-containing protein [Aeropyrum sp.]|nr:ABC-ATPase domain-containing protein [Aeropyrum sp.]